MMATALYAQDKDLFQIDVTGRIQGWDQGSTATAPAEQNLKGVLRVDGWVNVTPDGCLRVASRLATGDKFNNEWVNTGIGDSEASMNLALRQLYISSSCLKNITVDVGAAPVRRHGTLGLSESGYVDGINIVIDEEGAGRNWIISVGAVGGEPNLFKRDYDEINHASVQVKQEITKEHAAFVAVAKYKETMFTRGGISWALSKYSKWLKETGAEVLFADEHMLGGIVYAKFAVKNWTNTFSIAKITPDVNSDEKAGFLMKQFYGYGTNVYFEANRKVNDRMNLDFRVRLGDAGTRVQAGFTLKFGVRKRR